MTCNSWFSLGAGNSELFAPFFPRLGKSLSDWLPLLLPLLLLIARHRQSSAPVYDGPDCANKWNSDERDRHGPIGSEINGGNRSHYAERRQKRTQILSALRLSGARLKSARLVIDAVALLCLCHLHDAIRAVRHDLVEAFECFRRRKRPRPSYLLDFDLLLLLYLLLLLRLRMLPLIGHGLELKPTPLS